MYNASVNLFLNETVKSLCFRSSQIWTSKIVELNGNLIFNQNHQCEHQPYLETLHLMKSQTKLYCVE